MADEKTSPNGSAGKAQQQAPQIQAKIVSQYLKDMSFENPNIAKLMTGSGETPSLNVEVNVGANKIDGDLYESAIQLKAVASNNLGTIYVLETVYAGAFKIDAIPDDALEPFLLISGPTMIFPFVRRLIADVTREGGFPPLLLDPIDFAGLYLRRKKEMAESGKTAPTQVS